MGKNELPPFDADTTGWLAAPGHRPSLGDAGGDQKGGCLWRFPAGSTQTLCWGSRMY
jgi:hypothetical protein